MASGFALRLADAGQCAVAMDAEPRVLGAMGTELAPVARRHERALIRAAQRGSEEALEELQEKRVLIRYETEILRGKRAKVLDAKYILYPDMDFITEVKRANSRALKLDEVQSNWVPLPE